ncbi:carboxypeptidase regulatory-like domain-containing protein [Glaciecola sp. XM2]|uniref:TonB-dependent receptor n=1 Tax=Glaciecola sp. XM2 TaxID=1914931 RepID=UPI001BDE83C5|nr:TonB-dependent receptor [Glaciecola sp. XM2]MBT1451289.1 carboxypeptidase regulatory-like domain-containing protein [Glaciecola sp. XM2]
MQTSAQQVGEIVGKVSGTNGLPLEGVTIEAKGDVLPKPRTAESKANGSFRLQLLPPGNYEVTFTTASGETRTVSVSVFLDQTTPLNVQLNAGDVENIVVYGDSLTTSTNAALGNSLNAETLAQLPMFVEYSSLIRLMPGVQVTSDSVRGPSAGASGQDNGFRFDGANLSVPLFGILASSPSTHDVAHVSVERGGARAVGFNRNAGVTLNTESKSGTDEFTGDVTYRLQKGSWQAEDKDGLSTEDDIDFITVGVGGPIIPEQLYFYGSYYTRDDSKESGTNARGALPDITNEREEYFGKVTWTPTADILVNASYRTSEVTSSNQSIGINDTASTAENGIDDFEVIVFDASWIINDDTTLNISYADTTQSTGSFPVNDLGFRGQVNGNLDVNDLASQGLFFVPSLETRTGADAQEQALVDAFNAGAAPLISAFGIDGEALGAVGGASTVNDNRYLGNTFEVSLNHIIETDTMTHELHFGYQEEEGAEELFRVSNGWGSIAYWGGLDFDDGGLVAPDGDPVPVGTIYRATVQTRGFDAGGLTGPLVSKTKSKTIAVNDTIFWDDFIFDVGFLLSQDELIGQGLRPANTSSGYEEARGNPYVMKKVDFSETFQPRMTATWNYSYTASAFVSFARYNPAVSSLARAASWDRNTGGSTTFVYFDENGGFLDSETNISSTGKLFADGLNPRTMQEFIIGHQMEWGNNWNIRNHLRYRRSWNYWEDTNNNARIVYDAADYQSRLASFGDLYPDIVAAANAGQLDSPEPKELYVPVNNLVGEGTYVIAQLDGAYTKYLEASMEFDYRSESFFTTTSVVWSHYYGNFDQDGTTRFNNDQGTFIGSSNIADSWYGQLWGSFTDGKMRADRTWQLKSFGAYQLPWNASLGYLAYWQSGHTWAHQWPSTFYLEPRGSRRTPSHWQIDLNYTQNFDVSDDYSVQLRLDVFNIFDRQTGYNPQPRYNSDDLGEYRSYENPRRVQATVSLRF